MNQARESIWFEGRAGRFARLAIFVGILVHLAGFMAFRVTALPELNQEFPAPYVSIAASSKDVETLEILAALSDSEPLFLPTRWNVALPSQTAIISSEKSPFDTFPPEITIQTGAFKTAGQTSQPIPTAPSNALSLNTGSVFSTFGTDFPVQQPETIPGPLLEIFDYQSGALVKNYSLDTTNFEYDWPQLWRYGEYVVIVNETGSVGKPLLMTSTDHENLDRALSKFIQEKITREQLKPGYYRILIGP